MHRVALRPVFAGPRLRHRHPVLGVPAGGHGVLFTINYMLNTAYASEFIRRDRMGRAYRPPCLQAQTVRTLDASRAGVAVSTITIGQNLGNALAPIGGSFFVESFGYEGVFCGVGAATLFIGMLLLMWNYLREKRAGQ